MDNGSIQWRARCQSVSIIDTIDTKGAYLVPTPRVLIDTLFSGHFAHIAPVFRTFTVANKAVYIYLLDPRL